MQHRGHAYVANTHSFGDSERSRRLDQASDGDLLREMIGFMAQHLTDADVPGQVGAGPGERSETLENWRNGYRDRLVAFVISAFLASVD